MNASIPLLRRGRALVRLVPLLAAGLAAGWLSADVPKSSGADDTSRKATAGTESPASKVKEPAYEPKKKSELKRMLTPLQYKVTQNEETEPAFRNQYWDNKEPGLYRCVVCGLSLFSSQTKYKSGTGWPSFFAPIRADHVGYKTDWHLFYPRKEVHCRRCSAHLGHVFDDGPQDKTGKRYCMNSAALKFEPAEDGSSGSIE